MPKRPPEVAARELITILERLPPEVLQLPVWDTSPHMKWIGTVGDALGLIHAYYEEALPKKNHTKT